MAIARACKGDGMVSWFGRGGGCGKTAVQTEGGDGEDILLNDKFVKFLLRVLVTRGPRQGGRGRKQSPGDEGKSNGAGGGTRALSRNSAVQSSLRNTSPTGTEVKLEYWGESIDEERCSEQGEGITLKEQGNWEKDDGDYNF